MIRVAVIGGGAAGLCAARYLLAKPDVFEAVLYEQSDQVGGTWVYTDNVGKDKYGLPVHSSMYSNLRWVSCQPCSVFIYSWWVWNTHHTGRLDC